MAYNENNPQNPNHRAQKSDYIRYKVQREKDPKRDISLCHVFFGDNMQSPMIAYVN